MSQPCPNPELPPPAVPDEVKEEPPAESSTQPQAPQPEVPKPLQELPAKISTCIPEHCMYKNRLQEYAQRSSITLPIYKTVNEGADHMPMFRSTVIVAGASYTSLLTFTSRKAAEQDVAKIALDGISDKIKKEKCPLIYEDTIFCKAVLNDYAAKMNLPTPTYTTTKEEGLAPVFVSKLEFCGKSYTGAAGRNKKEAEQLAARTVIQSIFENSDSRTVMSEIVNSKSRIFKGVQMGSVPAAANPEKLATVTIGSSSGHPLNVPFAAIPASGVGLQTPYPVMHQPVHGLNVPSASFLASGLGLQTSYLAMNQPVHEFNKRKAESSLGEEITPPIAFVPPVMEQSPGGGSTSGKKKNRKNKKAKKEEAVADSQLTVVAVPLCQLPPCSVAQ